MVRILRRIQIFVLALAYACLAAGCQRGMDSKTPVSSPLIPSLVRIGQVDTPASMSAQAWNNATIAIAIFEQLGKQTEIYLIDRASGGVRSVTLPDSYIVYSMEFDHAHPEVLWVATSRTAQIFRLDTQKLTFERVVKLKADNFVFGLGLGSSGTVYFGTYPDGRLYAVVSNDGAWKLREISVDSDLTGGRTNVQTVIANSTGQVFFQIGSPGRLIGYDEKSGKLAAVLDTPDPFFFPVRDFPRVLKQVRGPADLHPYPLTPAQSSEDLPDGLRKLLPRTAFDVSEGKFRMTIEHDGMKTTLDTTPKQGGMPVVAFKKVGKNLAVGATYWNRWAFKFDMASEKIESLDVIGRTGEFFTACGDGQEVFIPHYLGTLLEYNPSAPLDRANVVPAGSDPQAISTDPKDNPREVLVIPDGHLGLSCVVDKNSLVYAMLPNYGQTAGLVARLVGGKLQTVVKPRQTYGQLVTLASTGQPSRLFAATSDFIGLGLKRSGEPAPMRVVELDPENLQELRSTEVPLERYRNSVGLINIGDNRLLLGTEGGGLFEVDVSEPEMTITHVGEACIGASSLTEWRDQFVAVICSDRLFIYSPESRGLSLATVLPSPSNFVTVGDSGNVYITSQSAIYRVSESTVAAAASRAARTPPSTAVSSASFENYASPNVLRRDQAGWLSQTSGAETIDGGGWVGLDYGASRPLEAHELEIVWTTPETTPPSVLVESSLDGRSWIHVSRFDTLKSADGKPYWTQTITFKNKHAARYWRVTPATAPAAQFGVEFLEFRS